MAMKKKGAAKGGVSKMRGGGMAKKGYAKGGVAKMRGGGMAKKGYAKGGVAKMTVAQLRSAAKKMGMKVVKA
tara:strand:+ start:28 stop:243 length:216 start_codon:yes stop_codon:yes gene_type:complete